MSDLNYWLVFFTAAVALNVSPGPDLIYILSRTIAQGTKVGLASAAGVCSGAIVHVLAAAFGLSAILAASALAFTIVKYVGAAYLVYLGVQALRSRGSTLELGVQKEQVVVTLKLEVTAQTKDGSYTETPTFHGDYSFFRDTAK